MWINMKNDISFLLAVCRWRAKKKMAKDVQVARRRNATPKHRAEGGRKKKKKKNIKSVEKLFIFRRMNLFTATVLRPKIIFSAKLAAWYCLLLLFFLLLVVVRFEEDSVRRPESVRYVSWRGDFFFYPHFERLSVFLLCFRYVILLSWNCKRIRSQWPWPFTIHKYV